MNTDQGNGDWVVYSDKRQEVHARLQALEQEIRVVHTPEEVEALGREIRGYTDRLAALVLERHLQASLDSEAHQEREAKLIRSWPGRLKSEGYETVRLSTRLGIEITVRVRYYRRVCDRRSGKRHKGG